MAAEAYLPPSLRVAAAGAPASCPGAAIAPDRVITGDFGAEQEGANVLLPFEVPAGTTAVRVKYCFDQPEAPTNAQLRHTLDLGVFDARQTPGELFDGDEFRGWGGSSHPDVTLSAEGYSSEAEYLASPRGHVPGKTTRGFKPGPVPAGEWAVELGVAAVVGQEGGDMDGRVAWRVEIELVDDPAFADEPYEPASFDETPAKSQEGWYAGDLHVHADHSALGDATMTEVFDYAFRSPQAGGAGLDFLTLSDYVAGSSWTEIGRYQADNPGKLVVRSAEVITYRGHLNAHGITQFTDYRTGPLLERAADGQLTEVRAPIAPSGLLEGIREAGGFTQVNHPTIFPSEVPGFDGLCRGCPWDYSDQETDWDLVDGYEVHTGPPGAALPDPFGPALGELGPNPFTVTAIEEYDRLRRAGHRIAAIGVSDSHNAGRTPNPVTQAPIGTGTTVVRAPELSEAGIAAGVRAGRTYVKVFGADSPDLRLDAVAGRATATIGERIEATQATFTAKVLGGVTTPQPRTLVVLRDGLPFDTVPVTSTDFTHTFTATEPGDYRLQVMRATAVDALTTPITVVAPRAAGPGPGAPAPSPGGGTPAGPPAGSNPRPPASGGARPRATRRATPRLRVRPALVSAGRRTKFRLQIFTGPVARPKPVAGVTIRFAGRRVKTDKRGRATVVATLRRPGLRRALTTRGSRRASVARVRVR